MSSNIKNIGFFFVCFAVAFTWFNSILEKDRVQRDPAAIAGKVFQISSLSSEQIRAQLQKNIKVTPTLDGKKAILFTGFSSALCKTYSKIEVEFVAEGIAVAGEAPVMTIVAPCEGGSDPSEMASIHLPVAQILKEHPKDTAFSFEGFSTTVSFNHSADEWPRQWVLKKVIFKNISGDDKSVSFNRAPASDSTSGEQPIVLEF